MKVDFNKLLMSLWIAAIVVFVVFGFCIAGALLITWLGLTFGWIGITFGLGVLVFGFITAILYYS